MDFLRGLILFCWHIGTRIHTTLKNRIKLWDLLSTAICRSLIKLVPKYMHQQFR